MNGLVWQLASRFRNSKNRSAFNSFIGSSSTFGIGLGCFVLIVLLSVMNGFEKALKEQLLSVVPHGELRAVSPQGLEDWQAIREAFTAKPEIETIQPFVKATALLQRGKQSKAVELTGISPSLSDYDNRLRLYPDNAWQQFAIESGSVLLGKQVMKKLGVQVGDKVQVLLPKANAQLKLSAPESIWLTVVGGIDIGGELDSYMAFMRMDELAQATDVTAGATGILLNYTEPFSAYPLTRELGYSVNQAVYMSDWTRTHGHLYQDIQLVRSVVYLALGLVIAVASFNIVSSLVMSVSEKQAEIAMLKTMGARSGLIAMVFVTQGLLNGVVGTCLGAFAGVITALNLSDIALFLESVVGFKLLSGDIYFIDFLPSELLWQDVWITVIIALLLSVLATLYPALRASRVEPAAVLGH